MPDDSYRSGVPRHPGAASDSVTDDPALQRPKYPTDLDDLPSIDLIQAGRPWGPSLIMLVAAAPTVLAVAFLFRTGRDLTVPFVLGEVVVLLTGLVVAVLGRRRGDKTYCIAGIIAGISALGLGILCAGSMILWVGFHEMKFAALATDAETGNAVPGVDVSFKEGENAAEAKTDDDGAAEVTMHLLSYGSSSLVCDTGGVSFGQVVVVLRAEGYEDFSGRLREKAGYGWSIHGDAPPPIRIQLTPKKR